MSRGRYLKVDPDRNNGLGHNRWLYCRFCGALNDMQRAKLGDGVGNEYQVLSTYGGDPLKYLPPDEVNIHLSDDDVHVLFLADYDGVTPKQTYKHPPVASTAVSGCWFCGSKSFA